MKRSVIIDILEIAYGFVLYIDAQNKRSKDSAYEGKSELTVMR